MRILRRRLLFIPVLVAVMAAGCMTATLKRSGQPDIEARIVGSDAQVIYVRNEAGQTFAIPRHEVADIDHPGNVLAAVGLPLAGIGAFVYAESNSPTFSADPTMKNVALAYLIPGVIMAGFGLYQWFSSTSAASPEAGPPEGLTRPAVFAMPIPLAASPTQP